MKGVTGSLTSIFSDISQHPSEFRPQMSTALLGGNFARRKKVAESSVSTLSK